VSLMVAGQSLFHYGHVDQPEPMLEHIGPSNIFNRPLSAVLMSSEINSRIKVT